MYGAIMDGTFQGSIKLPGDGTFHVETNRDKSSPFHSIMYSHEDIKWYVISNILCLMIFLKTY